MPSAPSLEHHDIPLNRDLFLRTLIRELAGILEEVIGHEETAGYISLVGQKMGSWINGIYRQSLGLPTLSPEQTARVLVDLKRRLDGHFSLIELNEEKMVLSSSACPFGEKVLDRPSMCMMTSNVFGVITAENLGYAKVALHETIAGRCSRCLVTVFIKQTDESRATAGREYFGE